MHRSIAAGMMALTGAFLFAAFVLQDIRIHPEISRGELPWGLITRYGLAMTAGGALVGFVLAGLFGRRGVLGWVLALVGGTVAASLSGLIGSAFGLLPELLSDGFSASDAAMVVAGLLILPLTAIEEPWILAVLAALIALTQILCQRQRTAR